MLLIGTTGYRFQHWNQEFYPSDVEDNKLIHYAKFSSLLELRETFYSIPDSETISEWMDNTPSNFNFMAKMLRSITHNKANKIPEEKIEAYFKSLDGLKPKLAGILLEFPIKFEKSEKNLTHIFNLISECKKHYDGQFFIEFQNRGWFQIDDEMKSQFYDNQITMVSTDKNPLSTLLRDPDIYYLRLLGDKNIVPKNEFGSKVIDRTIDLENWAEHLKFLSKRYKLIYVTLDNHFSGYAIRDAQILAKKLREKKVKIHGFENFGTTNKQATKKKKEKVDVKSDDINDNEDNENLNDEEKSEVKIKSTS